MRLHFGVALFFCLGVGGALAQTGNEPERDPPATGEELSASIPFVTETDTYYGVLVHIDWWFAVPEQWEISEEAELRLHYSNSPVLIERLSSMTAAVNGKAFDSTFLRGGEHKDLVVSWKIDPAYLKPGEMNKLTITAKMRSDLELCDDVHSPGLWMTIEDKSRLIIKYKQKAAALDLSKFPQSYMRHELYYTADKQEHTHVTIVVPTNAAPEIIEGIGVVSARLGAGTVFPRGRIAVWSVDAITADVRSQLGRSNLVIMGDVSFVNKFIKEGLDLGGSLSEAQAGWGYVVEARNPWNKVRRALVVTGGDGDAIAKAVGKLALPQSAKEWKAKDKEVPIRMAVIKTKPPVPTAKDSASDGPFTITMAQLGATDRSSQGKFHHYQQVAFPNPFVGRIKGPAFVRLTIAHSELLLPQTSSMLAKVNGEPVRSVRLSPRTAPGVEVDVGIPDRFLGERNIILRLEFFLDIGDPDCHYNFPEMAWVTLFAKSFIAYPLTDSTTTSLRSYPWVVAKEANLNGVTFVISDTPSDEVLSSVANVAAFLGKAVPRKDAAGRIAEPWVHPVVKRLGDLTEADRQRDLIVMGDYRLIKADPKLAEKVDQSLFAEEAPAENLKAYSEQEYRKRAGWIHLDSSPFNGSRNVLIVSGATGAAAVVAASEYLWVQRKVDQLGGSTVRVGANGNMEVLAGAKGEDVQAAPSGPIVARLPKPHKLDAASEDVPAAEATTAPGDAETPRGGPVAAPKAKHQVAYLVFVILGLLLVVLVVVRIRDALRSDPAAG